jgi:hypothetical protein
LHGNISTDPEGEKGREGAGEQLWEQESSSGSRRAALGAGEQLWEQESSSGSRRAALGAGEQLHPAPTWEHGGSMQEHGHVVVEYYCNMIGILW